MIIPTHGKANPTILATVCSETLGIATVFFTIYIMLSESDEPDWSELEKMVAQCRKGSKFASKRRPITER
jgi:hypothetical protein